MGDSMPRLTFCGPQALSKKKPAQMAKITLVALLVAGVLASAGCSRSLGRGRPPDIVVTVRNSIAEDAKLTTLWVQAQQLIATEPITLNAALVAEGKERPHTIRPDSRALGVSSVGVQVFSVPDLTVAQLSIETGKPVSELEHHTNPTGVIHAPANSGGAAYCAGFVQHGAIYVPASLLYSAGATGYEMQNVILSRLGYDTSRR